jgi:hypothetical protein
MVMDTDLISSVVSARLIARSGTLLALLPCVQDGDLEIGGLRSILRPSYTVGPNEMVPRSPGSRDRYIEISTTRCGL